MLSGVGRARGLLCVFLFMPFSSNTLQKVTVGPIPGTEPSMPQMPWTVQSTFQGRNSHATRESNSCREAAQSNAGWSEREAAVTLRFHSGAIAGCPRRSA